MLIPITNTPRDYSWGSTTLIAGLEGRASTGDPEAEIWYGDHAGNPSHVEDGSGRTLDVVLTAAGEPRLPFLMKILAAGSSLSIQAHPTKAQAVEGFAREERSGLPRDAGDRLYRDDNHKPEIIVALSDRFEALVGVRPVDATLRLLATLGNGPAITRLRELVAAEPALGAGRAAVAWALSEATAADVAEVTAALASADSDEFAAEIAVLRAAAADFPGDRGLFVALLMNLVVLHRGEALFAPAGVLHAYQRGLGVELMAASDNVLRGGLTPKHVDVPELLRVLDATPGPAPLVEPLPLAGADDHRSADAVAYAPPVADFALTRVEVGAAPQDLALRGPAVVLATVGSVQVDADDEKVVLAPAQAVYAGGGVRTITLSGHGEAFIAQRGQS